jgi:hypothetical protein
MATHQAIHIRIQIHMLIHILIRIQIPIHIHIVILSTTIKTIIKIPAYMATLTATRTNIATLTAPRTNIATLTALVIIHGEEIFKIMNIENIALITHIIHRVTNIVINQNHSLILLKKTIYLIKGIFKPLIMTR